MVTNQPLAKATADPISVVIPGTPGTTEAIKFADLTEEDGIAILESARPFGARRRDSYYQQIGRQAWINLLYWVGIQSFDAVEVLENVDPGVLMESGGYVANHILRLGLGNVARLSAARIDWSVMPNTPDQQDQDGARVGQSLLDHLYTALDLGEKGQEVAFWLEITGTCFAYANWDSSKGQVRRFYRDPFTKQRLAPQQVQPQQKQWLDGLGLFTDENDGDHDCEILSLFDVWVPTAYRKLDKMPWYLIRRTMSLEEVYDRWPEKAKELPVSEPMTNRLDQYRNRIATLAKRPGFGLVNSIDDDGACDVDEFWYPPSKRMPEGLYIAGIKNHILELDRHKFAQAGLDIRSPLVDFHNIRVPGRFHSMSTTEHLIQPQNEYNKARQQLIQHRDVLSVPQWVAEEGSLARSVVRNEAGDILEYKRGKPRPELQNPPALGDAQLVTGQQATTDMQVIAAFSDASLGQMPQGARSGNAVQMLQERDQLVTAPTTGQLERQYAKFGSHLLKLEWKFRKYPSAIQLYGESRQADIRYFKGEDLNGNCRVTVRPGSMTPKSKAATIELLGSLADRGVLNPMDPRQQRLILEAVEVGGVDRLFTLLDGHRRRARIENSMFAKASPDPGFALPDVLQYDNHQVHWETHEEFMLTDEFELLHPMVKMMFLAHQQKHVDAIAQMMAAAAAVQQASGGGGESAAPGGGSPKAKPLGKPSPPRQTQKTSATANASNP